MGTMQTDGNSYDGGLPSMNAHQSMSARTSRSNSLIRPGTGVEEQRKMSAVDFANGRVNFGGGDFRGGSGLSNNISHELHGYGGQQNQNSSAVSAHPNPYPYDHGAAHQDMSQNNMPIKSEDTSQGSYGRTLPNIDGMSSAQDASFRWNGDQPDNYMMTSASGPIPGKTSGVLTANNF
jgi:hypothetical protein